MNEHGIRIEILNGMRSEFQDIEVKTKKRAREILYELWESDYLGCVYRLWIDGDIELELGE